MSAYKEIVTKAVVGKGKKYYRNTYVINTDSKPNTVLGCWVINHKFSGHEVDDRIEDAFNGVSEGKFDINPKRIGKINKGCEFCKYYDICYRKENDIVNLKEVKFGGEEE